MQHRLLGYVSAFAAFQWVAIAILGTPTAMGEETAWDPFASESASTLGAQVAPQDFDLSTSVFEKIGQAKQAKPESLQLRPARPLSPKTQAPKPQKSRSTQNQSSKTVKSPFTKWISPKDESREQNQAEPVEPEDDSLSKAKPIPTPQVARRIRLPASSRSSSSREPAPSDKKSRSKKKSSSKRSQTKSPLVVRFPTPVAEPTTPSIKIDPSDLPPLTQSQQRLRVKIRRVLNHYYQRPLNTRDRSPWEMMHALLAYEVDSKILLGGPQGKPISAVGWLCFNQSCKRRTLMYVSDSGELRVRVGPALQGHRGQLLAMLAQAKVSKSYPMRIEGHDFTVGDLAKMEMRTCYPRTELTFKLIGLMHYLDSEATWMNDQGMEWNIPRLISEEIRQPVRGAACGGTHRLAGLTLAYKTRQLRGEPIDGQYLKAQKFIARYQQYAYRLQNRDGSFSTEWFRGPGNEKSIDRKLKTTGHLLEWLLYAASEKQLRHKKTANAANYLATIMVNNRNKNWEAGPLGHAIHALLLYDRMVFSHYDEPKNLPLAVKLRRSASTNSKR